MEAVILQFGRSSWPTQLGSGEAKKKKAVVVRQPFSFTPFLFSKAATRFERLGPLAFFFEKNKRQNPHGTSRKGELLVHLFFASPLPGCVDQEDLPNGRITASI